MMKHFLHRYSGNTQFEADYNGANYDEPWVSVTDGDASGRVDYNKPAPAHDYSKDYFTIEALSAGTLNVVMSPYTTGTLAYKVNNEEYWHMVPRNVEDYSVTQVPVQTGDKVIFMGALNEGSSLFQSYEGHDNTLPMKVYGNIQSLYYENDFSGETTCKAAGNMFGKCTGLVDASNLVLPATTLTEEAYFGMFNHCTSLTTAPELPATALNNECYSEMFYECSSLVTAPALPATTLVSGCYSTMFHGCTSLTTAPVLSATTLASMCYYEMFGYCTGLSSITCLATDISAANCTDSWVNGVSSTGTFTKAASMSSWTTGESGIPSSWTVIDA